jgi:hypothetical protein
MIYLHKKLPTSLTVSAMLLGLIVFASACTHRKVMQLGTHKVTVARHGFEKKLQVSAETSIPTFEYAGMSADGRGLKVSIKGDKITVNGTDGQLRPGDSVLIGDHGVAVNSLDYGETEKYLRANKSGSETATVN